VVNLQKTGADPHSKLRIGAKIDDVMVPLMEMLGIPIPQFELSRLVSVARRDAHVVVRGLDTDQTPNDLLWNVQVGYAGDAGNHGDGLGRVEFNQDALSRKANLPQPGEGGTLTQWPWNSEDGRAHVTTDRGGSWTVSPDICNISDGVVQDEATGAPLFNAGSRVGALLEHMAPDSLSAECSSVKLMFRSHYREPPLVLPAPADQSETLYRIVYNPQDGTWAEPQVLERSGTAPMCEAIDVPTEQLGEVSVTLQDQAAGGEVETRGAELFMNVSYQEDMDSDKYRCFHQLRLEGELERIASVRYNTPGQGFREEMHNRTDPPFQMKFGPCWGRPHVTLDVVFKDGTVLEAVWSENLPAANERIQLAAKVA
jgi:hypothetical protein